MIEENRADQKRAADDPLSAQLQDENDSRPTIKEIFRQSFNKAQRQNQPKSRSGLGRDHSRSLVLLGGAAVIVLLLFLMVFSSPNRQGRSANTETARNTRSRSESHSR